MAGPPGERRPRGPPDGLRPGGARRGAGKLPLPRPLPPGLPLRRLLLLQLRRPGRGGPDGEPDAAARRGGAGDHLRQGPKTGDGRARKADRRREGDGVLRHRPPLPLRLGAQLRRHSAAEYLRRHAERAGERFGPGGAQRDGPPPPDRGLGGVPGDGGPILQGAQAERVLHPPLRELGEGLQAGLPPGLRLPGWRGAGELAQPRARTHPRPRLPRSPDGAWPLDDGHDRFRRVPAQPR